MLRRIQQKDDNYSKLQKKGKIENGKKKKKKKTEMEYTAITGNQIKKKKNKQNTYWISDEDIRSDANWYGWEIVSEQKVKNQT